MSRRALLRHQARISSELPTLVNCLRRGEDVIAAEINNAIIEMREKNPVNERCPSDGRSY